MEEMVEHEDQAHLHKEKLQQLQAPQVQQQPERRKVMKKPPSIHDAAYTGNLKVVQMKLQENGAVINLRNPIVSPVVDSLELHFNAALIKIVSFHL